jgi:hypothetical protein
MARSTFKKLKARVPLALPIRLEWVDKVDPQENLAECNLIFPTKRCPYYRLRISKHEISTLYEAWEMVVHEYAHALSWSGNHRNLPDHGPLWGIAYSVCYTQAERR